VNAEGDSTLLAAVAEVQGLEELAVVVKPLGEVAARVRVVSPGPTIYLSVPAPPGGDYAGD